LHQSLAVTRGQRLCGLDPAAADVVIGEDVLPCFWQTIEDDLVKVF
jgi:hypothetical protein